MKKNRRVAMIILWLALTVGFTIFSWKARDNALNPVTVYRIAQDIPLNSKVGATDFQAVEIPGDAVTDNMIKDPTPILDEGLHASTKLISGQYAVEEMFIGVEDIDPFEVTDLTEMRQITIPVDYVNALAGNIKKGDKVDLMYVGADEGYTYSRTFAQNVLVYSTTTGSGYRFQDHSDRLEGTPMANTEDDMALEEGVNVGDISQITLAASPQLVEEISTRLATGQIRIVGRFNESEDSDTVGYVIGEFERRFSGQANPETNK